MCCRTPVDTVPAHQCAGQFSSGGYSRGQSTTKTFVSHKDLRQPQRPSSTTKTFVSHKDLRQPIDSLYQLMKTFIPKASHNHIVQVIINIATFSIPYDCTYGMENEQACVVIVVG